ncbi:hypothetical protein BC938DRAFT_478285, partial [Jimgerdemannia flammicorona]
MRPCPSRALPPHLWCWPDRPLGPGRLPRQGCRSHPNHGHTAVALSRCPPAGRRPRLPDRPTHSDVATAQEIRRVLREAPEVSLECTGIESSFRMAIRVTHDGGCYCLVRVGKNDQTLPVNDFAMREVDIKGLFRYHHILPTSAVLRPKAIRLLQTGKLDVKGLVTHQFDFKDALKAFEVAADYSKGSIKVQIVS